jgi:3-deoxy-D-manno-octulosonic-acid transferase
MWMYRLLLALLMPYLLGRLVWRSLTGAESWQDIKERLGALPPKPGSAQTAWMHAASVGELKSAKPLIEALLARFEHLELLITCNSLTGRALVSGWGHPRVTVQLSPLDLSRNTHAIIDQWSPRALFILENELWPNRLTACHKRGVPVALIAARLSERSARLWHMFGAAKSIFAKMSLVSAQTAESERRFKELGIPSRAFAPILNLKALYQVETQHLVPPSYPREHVLLAASTHSGEDRTILQAFQMARESWPELRLILAPRHLDRTEEVTAELKDLGLSYATRSTGILPDGASDVFLANTLGEMDQWYHSAALCFVGGSLVEVGGHTPFEPISHDSAILHGPHVRNFVDSYRDLAALGAGIRVDSTEDLTAAILSLRDSTKRRQMTDAAKTLLLDPKRVQDIVHAVSRFL